MSDSLMVVPDAASSGSLVVQCDDVSPSRQSWHTLHSLYSQSLKDAQLAWDERAAVLAHALTAGREVSTLTKQLAMTVEDLARAHSENLELRKRTSELQATIFEKETENRELRRMLEDQEGDKLRAQLAAQEVPSDDEREEGWFVGSQTLLELQSAIASGIRLVAPNVTTPPMSTAADVLQSIRDYSAFVRQYVDSVGVHASSRAALATEEAANHDARITALSKANTDLQSALTATRQVTESLQADVNHLLSNLRARDEASRQQFERVVQSLPIALLHLARNDADAQPLDSWDAVIAAIRDLGLLCVAQEQDALAERDRMLTIEATHHSELSTLLQRLREAESALENHLTTRMSIHNQETQVSSAVVVDSGTQTLQAVPDGNGHSAGAELPSYSPRSATTTPQPAPQPSVWAPRTPPSPKCLAVTLPSERALPLSRPVLSEPSDCDVSDGNGPDVHPVDVRIHRATPLNATPPQAREASAYRASPAISPPSVPRTGERSATHATRGESPGRHARCEACAARATTPIVSTALFSTADAEKMLSRAATIGPDRLKVLAKKSINTTVAESATAKPAAVVAVDNPTGLTKSKSRSSSPAVSLDGADTGRFSAVLPPRHTRSSSATTTSSTADISIEILSVIAALDRRVESALASTARR